MNDSDDLHGLPGAELIRKGLSDLRANIESVPALLVEIGFPRLTRLRLVDANELPSSNDAAELRLYRLLRRLEPRNAYSQYNAFIRTLISFERALEHRAHRIRVNPTERPFGSTTKTNRAEGS